MAKLQLNDVHNVHLVMICILSHPCVTLFETVDGIWPRLTGTARSIGGVV